ncbi:MAG: hypothetical protein WCU00_10740 [Candidatus Latescibacterota bacterium]
MSASGKKKEEYNQNWESEIAAYDAECNAREAEFRNQHIVFEGSSGVSDLTEEENEVFTLMLRGTSCSEIAEQFGVEEELISGLAEIIRAKLSLSDT